MRNGLAESTLLKSSSSSSLSASRGVAFHIISFRYYSLPNHYAGRSKSPATIAAYASGWRDFLDFCQLRGLEPLPATDQTVADNLAWLADSGMKAATIARRLVFISQAHKAADLPSPTITSLVARTHAGIRRSLGTAQTPK